MESLSYEEFKKRYGTVGLAIAKQPPKPNWGQRVTEQFKSGLSYAKEGIKGLSPLGPLDPRPKQMLKNTEALGKIGSGVLQSAFSPVTATVQPVLEPTLGRGMNAVANKIAENPSVQKFASSKAGELAERATETVRNYSDIAGAVVGPKVAGRTLSTGARIVKQGSQGIAENISQTVKPIKDASRTTFAEVSRIPDRMKINMAEKRAAQQVIDELPSPNARKAAQDGIDVADIQEVINLPLSQKPALKKLWEGIRDYSDKKSIKEPMEMIGNVITRRIKEVENEAGKVGSKLGEVANELGVVSARETFDNVFNQLKQVPGLEGLKVKKGGVLDFSNTNMITDATNAGRKAIQDAFSKSIKWGSGKKKHLLRQELFEVLGGKKAARLNLTATEEKALNAIRRGLSDLLESKSPQYKQLSGEFARMMEPLKLMRKMLKSEGIKDADILDMKAGQLARRLTGTAVSRADLQQALQLLDDVTIKKGASRISAKAMQDFYNILERYYDITPKTGFQGQVKKGIETATGVRDIVVGKIRDLAGETPAVRRKALEDFLDELLNSSD